MTSTPRSRRLFTWLAALWTAVILGLCFLPAKEIPNVRIPLADKWVHFVIFGLWAWLVLKAIMPGAGRRALPAVALAAGLFGWLVEALQGQLKFLGRAQDDMDTLADAIGGALGVLIFFLLNRKRRQTG